MPGGSRERLLIPTEVQAILGVTQKTLGRWADSGRMPCVRTPGGHRRYRAVDVERLRLELGRDAPATPSRPEREIPSRRSRRLLKPEEAAAVLDVDQWTVRRWADAGLLPFVRTEAGHRRWRRGDLEKFLANRGLRG